MNDTVYVAQKTLEDFSNINSGFSVKDWVFIVFALVNMIILVITVIHIRNSPVKAVKTAERLQTLRSKSDRIYNNKFSLFATILGIRHARASNEQFVIAINQIPIVFNDNKMVLHYLSEFIENHNDNINPIEKVLDSLDSSLNKMVLEMAKDIDYGDIDPNVMINCFYPDASLLTYASQDIYNHLYSNQNLEKYLSSVGKVLVKLPITPQDHQ
ncbi:MAG: hypothetical protein H7263_03935 [Candidatus Sericytochromatia bacterium]|nr:hypothetical protein [Candidatus Sericytochromatia bacterium]